MNTGFVQLIQKADEKCGLHEGSLCCCVNAGDDVDEGDAIL